MTKIIAVSNGKGGAGKTTTSIQLLSILSSIYGKKCLGIDLDPQGNLGLGLGIKNKICPGVYDLIKLGQDVRQFSISQNLDMITSNQMVGNLPQELANEVGRELLLSDAIEPFQEDYDYIVIDCPPQFSMLTDNAYSCADSILVPMSIDMYSIDGVAELKKRKDRIKKILNPHLLFEGILITNAKKNTNACRRMEEMTKLCAEKLETKCFHTLITSSTVVPDAQASFQTLLEYKPRSKVTADYLYFVEELIRGE